MRLKGGDGDEEGRWKGRDRTTKNGRRTGRGNNDGNNYAPPHPEL